MLAKYRLPWTAAYRVCFDGIISIFELDDDGMKFAMRLQYVHVFNLAVFRQDVGYMLCKAS